MAADTSFDEARIRRLYLRAPFVRDLGLTLDGAGPGWCEASLAVEERHLQQDGFVHAGVVTTLADHTGGGAGWTCTAEGQTVLTVEFKVSLVRPARGARLRCRSEVVRAERSLIFTEATVFSVGAEGEKLVARLSQTLAVADETVGAVQAGEP